MKALVLSGGTGTRLRPFTYSTPKQLMPVVNKPVLQHCLETIRETGITDVGLVVGEHSEQIRSLLGDGNGLGLRITYIPQDRPAGLAHCVLIAQRFLGDDDFLMYLGDNVLANGLRAAVADFVTHRPDVKLLVSKVTDPRQYGVAEYAADGTVTRLVEKPQHPRSNFAVMGVYLFSPAVHAVVRGLQPSRRGELEITDAIQDMLTGGAVVKAEEYCGYWKDTGTIEDLLDCNGFLLDALRGEMRGERDRHSRILGEVVVEPGATIIRSQVRGPVIIGAGSVVEDTAIGPHTSIGRDCRLSGAVIEESIVLDGAAIRGVTGISDSLIGQHAEVRGKHGSGAIRLIVGDHAYVADAA